MRQQPSRLQEQPDLVDTSSFPTVDKLNPKPRIGRDIDKSKRYNRSHGRPLSEGDETFLVSEWDVGLPALPVARSSGVAIGTIVSADAYLSEDTSEVYSEFAFQIDQVIKNDDESPLRIGGSVMVERIGGRVTFPSGKFAVSQVNHQDMPRKGGRYVLFLTHSFPKGGQLEDFYLLTGYELRGGHVFPLDKIPSRLFTAHKGVDETTFLRD